MTVTATEFKLNMGHYFDIIRESNETIVITKNGKIIAELVKPRTSATEYLSSMLSDREIARVSDYKDYRDIVIEEKYGITL